MFLTCDVQYLEWLYSMHGLEVFAWKTVRGLVVEIMMCTFILTLSTHVLS